MEIDAIRQSLAEQLNEALDALREAREMLVDWGGYVPQYFADKHDLDGDIAKLDAILAKHKEPK